MDILTHVVSSTATDETEPAVDDEKCPREILGFNCLTGTGFGCLCELATSTTVEEFAERSGTVKSMRVTFELKDSGTHQLLMKYVDLMGYKADYQISNRALECMFNFRRPQNTGLNLLVNHIR